MAASHFFVWLWHFFSGLCKGSKNSWMRIYGCHFKILIINLIYYLILRFLLQLKWTIAIFPLLFFSRQFVCVFFFLCIFRYFLRFFFRSMAERVWCGIAAHWSHSLLPLISLFFFGSHQDHCFDNSIYFISNFSMDFYIWFSYKWEKKCMRAMCNVHIYIWPMQWTQWHLYLLASR